jgi:hypothetical protein
MAEREDLYSDHPRKGDVGRGGHTPANDELVEGELRLGRGEVEVRVHGRLFDADLATTAACEPPAAATCVGTTCYAIACFGKQSLAAAAAAPPRAIRQLPFTCGSCVRGLIPIEGVEEMELQDENKDVDEDRPEDACGGANEGRDGLARRVERAAWEARLGHLLSRKAEEEDHEDVVHEEFDGDLVLE